jgi:hypothetical protein
LEDGRSRTEQEAIELAVFDGVAEDVESARNGVRGGIRDRDQAVQERDFVERPASDLAEAVEENHDGYELDAGHEELSDRLHHERRTVLQLSAERNRRVVPVESERVHVNSP